ncbi:MAG: plasmid maintenance system killer protein [Alphaproteobacteria bacterium]|nr:MAG: plasmid maintenance system killer protein [Alphaproteobacteria bacterium]
MIRDFADKETERFWLTGQSRKIAPDIQKRAYRKLQMLDAATILEDLRIPPSNQLEKLQGDRKDFYSIRINRQWRICFCWNGTDVSAVEVVDYH